jgi:hypothetical protein
MTISNGINSDDFSRENVITMYKVVQYMGGILTQFPVNYSVNLTYDAATSTATFNNLRSNTGASFSLVADSISFSSRSGITAARNISFSTGANSTGVYGVVTLQSGTSFVTIDNTYISLVGPSSSAISVGDSTGLQGAASDISLVVIAAGTNAAYTAGTAIQLQTNGGTQLEIIEQVFGVPKMAFFGGVPAAKPAITGSRTGASALELSILNALTVLGLATDSTTA